MQSYKIFNDPVHGFIAVPRGLILDVIDHPYFQRLRRIKQLGLSDYVYPGATHSRFHHALGAMHLMTLCIESLQLKGVDITAEEKEAAQLAILLHDIGHGPFSHALEGMLIAEHHEWLSLAVMHQLNEVFSGRLDRAIAIFSDQYEKAFLHQLVSSQLDMDRLDYISRDAYYTGVAEGVIGYDRIIKMLHVVDDQLVVEEKGIYSVEKFLVSRRLMYWQVYLHKTAIAAEQMLIAFIAKVKDSLHKGGAIGHDRLTKLWENKDQDPQTLLSTFLKLDDMDILQLVKWHVDHKDSVIRLLAKGILDRKLFKVRLKDIPFQEKEIFDLKVGVSTSLDVTLAEANEIVLTGSETNAMYKTQIEEIKVLQKDGVIRDLSSLLHTAYSDQEERKYFVCFPSIGEVKTNFAVTKRLT